MNDLILIAISFLYIFFVIGLATFIDRSSKEKTELPRKLIHILVGNWVFLGPFFESYWTMIFTPLVFVIVNYFSIKSQTFRSMDGTRDSTNYGTVYYAISLILLTSLSYYTGRWLYALLGVLIMAYGDGLAALFGIKYGFRNFKVNPNKTYEGSFIVFIFGFIITLILPLYYFESISISFLFFLAIGLLNGLYSTVLELAGRNGCDNLLLPLGSGIMGGIMIYHPSKGLFLSLLVSTIIVTLAFRKKALSLDGAAIAVLIGAVLYLAGGVNLYLALIGFFILGSLVSLASNPYKKAIKNSKLEQAIGRNAFQVLANSLPALIFACLYALSDDSLYLLLAFVIFAGASADTFGSEIGTLSKRNPISLVGFKKVPRGLSGGVSLLGILASIVGALILSFFVYPEFGKSGIIFCTVLGFLGSLIDSILGSLFQRKYLTSEGILSDYKENIGDIPVMGLSFVSNNTINLISLIIIGLVGYLLI